MLLKKLAPMHESYKTYVPFAKAIASTVHFLFYSQDISVQACHRGRVMAMCRSVNAFVMVLEKRSGASISLMQQKQFGLLMWNERVSAKVGPRNIFLH